MSSLLEGQAFGPFAAYVLATTVCVEKQGERSGNERAVEDARVDV